uniref:Uncharacterized protein n=1 Tax=Anguilla anguilla TaxID=7936 RepID=A0A0E9V131_ANGAN
MLFGLGVLGTASIFTPKAGTAHECKTSSAVTNTRTGDSIGTTIRWSVSSSRNCPGAKSCVGIMYESNPRSS